MNVAIVHRRLSHYRLPLYHGLLERDDELELTVYCGSDDTHQGKSGIPVEGEDPAFVSRLRNRTVRFRERRLVFQPELFRRLRNTDPDVVVFEGSLSFISNFLLLTYRRLTGKRSILWLKGWPNADRDGRVVRVLKRTFLQQADALIVYGETSRDLLERYRAGRPITVLQNTVDVSNLLDAQSTETARAHDEIVRSILSTGRPFIFYIGRHVAPKAIPDLVEGLSRARESGGVADLGLVIAGTGPDTDEIRRRATNCGIEVTFTGSVDEHDAALLFRNAHMCVFPGAVGLALNQAMAAGRAVICADEVGPDTEMLADGVNGLRYPKGDCDSLAEAITTLANEPQLRDAYGKAARRTIRRRATMPHMVESFYRALQSVSQETDR